MKKSRDDYVKRLNGIYFSNLQKDNVEYVKGHATFTGPREVSVGDQKYTAKHILIATGTKPMVPQTPGVCVCVCVCVCVAMCVCACVCVAVCVCTCMEVSCIVFRC